MSEWGEGEKYNWRRTGWISRRNGSNLFSHTLHPLRDVASFDRLLRLRSVCRQRDGKEPRIHGDEQHRHHHTAGEVLHIVPGSSELLQRCQQLVRERRDGRVISEHSESGKHA